MSPRYEITLTLLEAAWDTNRRCRDASNAILQLRQEESTVSELGVPLSTFLIFHSSYSHPSCAPRTARAVFSSRTREERRGEWYWEPTQSERAERRYLKHMQRVQLRSGRPPPPLPLPGRERGAKSLGQWRLAFGCPESDSRRFMRPRRRRRSTFSSSSVSSFFRAHVLLFRLLHAAISSFSLRLPDRHSRSAHSFDENARSRKVRDTRFKSVEVRLPRNSFYVNHSNYQCICIKVHRLRNSAEYEQTNECCKLIFDWQKILSRYTQLCGRT